MDINFVAVEIAEEEVERIEHEEQMELGQIRPYDQTLEFYLRVHRNDYPRIYDYVYPYINELNINTVGEFIDAINNDLINRLVEHWPHLADPRYLEELEEEKRRMLDNVLDGEGVIIHIGGDDPQH